MTGQNVSQRNTGRKQNAGVPTIIHRPADASKVRRHVARHEVCAELDRRLKDQPS